MIDIRKELERMSYGKDQWGRWTDTDEKLYQELCDKVDSALKIQAMIEHAIKQPIEDDCYGVQKGIIKLFRNIVDKSKGLYNPKENKS